MSIIIRLVFVVTHALTGYLSLNCRALFSRNAHEPIAGLKKTKPTVIKTMPYNKQLNNLDGSVVAGNSQSSAYRIDLAIARSVRQDLSLRFSRNDLTLGY